MQSGSVTVERSKKTGGDFHLVLRGEIGVERVREIKDLLVNAIWSGSTVFVDTREVTDVDLSFLQLMVAAARTATARGVPLDLTGCLGEGVQQRIREAGYGELLGDQTAEAGLEDSAS